MTGVAASAPAEAPRAGEQTRARYPDASGYAERAGRRVHWEVYGDGSPTIMFLPTWSLVHSRTWKMQIAYFARHYRVLTFDGLGNGRSDRPLDRAAYDHTEFARDALAVMDATDTDRAVMVSLSRGAQWGLVLAAEHPERVQAALFLAPFFPLSSSSRNMRIGLRLGLGEHSPEESRLARLFAHADERAGWFNAGFARSRYPVFAERFIRHAIFEPHSSKGIEDALAWAAETDGPAIAASMSGDLVWKPRELRAVARRVGCPATVVCGTEDPVTPVRDARALAKLIGARFVPVQGADHVVHGRRPVLFNLVLRELVEELDA